MSDAYRRRGIPDRWLLPPAPTDPALAARWDALELETQRTLARTGPDEVSGRPVEERELVVGLARRRLATSWRVLAGAPLLGWLVLMTVWGFGRSTYPDAQQRWLVAGLLLGAAVWAAAAVRATRRLRRARQLIADDERPV